MTTIRPGGVPLFTDKVVAEPWRQPVRHAGTMGRFDVLANVPVVTPRRRADRIFEQALADTDAECMAGPSRLPNAAGLSYKVIGTQTALVESRVRAFWNLVRQEVTGAPIPSAPLWG